MKEKKKITEELNELSPFLSKMKKENSFQVPPNYFEKMQREVLAKTKQSEEEQQATSVSWLGDFFNQLSLLLQPRVALALTGVAALAIFVFFTLSRNEVTTQELNLAEISSEEMQDYLADNLEDIDDDILLEITNELSENYFNLDLDYSEDDVEGIIDELLDDMDDNTLEDLL